jgi:hypothetical protein
LQTVGEHIGGNVDVPVEVAVVVTVEAAVLVSVVSAVVVAVDDAVVVAHISVPSSQL